MIAAGRYWLVTVSLGLAACGEPGSPAAAPPAEAMVLSPGAEPAALLSASCSGCHIGPAGQPAPIPGIEGLTAEAMAALLTKYRLEADGETVMHRIARGYTEDELATIAAYLGQGEK